MDDPTGKWLVPPVAREVERTLILDVRSVPEQSNTFQARGYELADLRVLVTRGAVAEAENLPTTHVS